MVDEVTPKVTLEEHVTRALLVGLVYDTWTDTYRHRGAASRLLYRGALDGQSMEPLTAEEVKQREVRNNRIANNFMSPGRVPGHEATKKDIRNFERFTGVIYAAIERSLDAERS